MANSGKRVQEPEPATILGAPRSTVFLGVGLLMVVILGMALYFKFAPAAPTGKGDYRDTLQLMPAANSPQGGTSGGSATMPGTPANGGMPVVAPNGGMPVVAPNGGMPVVPTK